MGMCVSDGSISENKICSQVVSFAVAVVAMYSASVLKRATGVCFFDDQLMAAPAIMKVYPEINQ